MVLPCAKVLQVQLMKSTWPWLTPQKGEKDRSRWPEDLIYWVVGLPYYQGGLLFGKLGEIFNHAHKPYLHPTAFLQPWCNLSEIDLPKNKPNWTKSGWTGFGPEFRPTRNIPDGFRTHSGLSFRYCTQSGFELVYIRIIPNQPEFRINSEPNPDCTNLCNKRLVFQWTYLSRLFFSKRGTTTRNILPTIVESLKLLDLSPYPLKHLVLLRLGRVDLDLHFHQRDLISPSIPLRNLLLLGSLEP